jgi:hypothetical protein
MKFLLPMLGFVLAAGLECPADSSRKQARTRRELLELSRTTSRFLIDHFRQTFRRHGFELLETADLSSVALIGPSEERSFRHARELIWILDGRGERFAAREGHLLEFEARLRDRPYLATPGMVSILIEAERFLPWLGWRDEIRLRIRTRDRLLPWSCGQRRPQRYRYPWPWGPRFSK